MLIELALALALGAGCSSTLPAPPMGNGEHNGLESQVVLTMPPPGKVEVVPVVPPGLKSPIWIDGEWEWTGRRWVWKEHGWEQIPPGKVYEPPVTTRLPDGRLVHYRGAWKQPDAPAP